jgi:hypothetical protein
VIALTLRADNFVFVTKEEQQSRPDLLSQEGRAHPEPRLRATPLAPVIEARGDSQAAAVLRPTQLGELESDVRQEPALGRASARSQRPDDA